MTPLPSVEAARAWAGLTRPARPDEVPFLRAIAACPEDELPRLALADYLDERGDWRAAALRLPRVAGGRAVARASGGGGGAGGGGVGVRDGRRGGGSGRGSAVRRRWRRRDAPAALSQPRDAQAGHK